MEKIFDKLSPYIETTVGVILIVIIGFLAIKLILKITKKALIKTTLDEAMYKFILNVEKILLAIVLIVVLLGYMNVPTAPLVTILGAGGAAIALALKDSLGNIAGGILILANKPFKKGDEVDVAGINGEVDSIDLFVTTMKTFDNKVVSIPNGVITTSVIVNYSREKIRRVDCQFGISYESDIAKAKSVLLQVAASCPDVLQDPPPAVGVADHGDSSIMLDCKVWCDTQVYYSVRYYMREQVKLAFDEAGITIPYPQMDVRVIK